MYKVTGRLVNSMGSELEAGFACGELCLGQPRDEATITTEMV